VIESSAIAGLAVYAIWTNQTIWKQYNSEIYAMREESIRALHQNTEAITKLCMLLNHRDD